ncbi:hypothetical protein CDAR_547461 [Caerostris darwini]|uniref:Uncharacterized protein n=1 Tax=Caerostris darwini TaxID=1538125 RepID=A0AAV4QF93_9ARAC|nr:hypothetical protein CDAR_547461 [Caerostris darwini]
MKNIPKSLQPFYHTETFFRKSRIQSIFFAVSACLQGLAVKRRLSRDGPAKEGAGSSHVLGRKPSRARQKSPLKSFFRFIEEFQRSRVVV